MQQKQSLMRKQRLQRSLMRMRIKANKQVSLGMQTPTSQARETTPSVLSSRKVQRRQRRLKQAKNNHGIPRPILMGSHVRIAVSLLLVTDMLIAAAASRRTRASSSRQTALRRQTRWSSGFATTTSPRYAASDALMPCPATHVMTRMHPIRLLKAAAKCHTCTSAVTLRNSETALLGANCRGCVQEHAFDTSRDLWMRELCLNEAEYQPMSYEKLIRKIRMCYEAKVNVLRTMR